MSQEIDMIAEKTKLEKKFFRRMSDKDYHKFAGEHAGMTKEQLDARVLELTKTRQGIINTRNADKELKDLKEEVRAQNGEYNKQLKANEELTRYASLLISEKYGDKLMDLQNPEDEDEEK